MNGLLLHCGGQLKSIDRNFLLRSTIRNSRTSSFGQKSPSFHRPAPFVPAGDSAAYSAIITEMPHEFASFEFMDTTGSSAHRMWLGRLPF